jgi:sugar phosphate isomerase/epimerase
VVRAVTGTRPFGISTHLYHNHRLSREHLSEISSYGFEAVEVFATPTHIDYHNPAAVADLQQWLAEARLQLHGVHAPVGESFSGGRWGPLLSLASSDAATRTRAVAEAEAALQIARRIAFKVFVVHLGVPRHERTAGARDGAIDNSRDGARRSVDELRKAAEPLGVRIAVEVIPNELSRAESLVYFIEEVVDAADVGICLDFGHAHIDGDLVDAIETVSEHLITTHVHDNRGRTDDHLVPFEGTIDWPGTLTAVQKIGYEGTLLLELAAKGSARDTLERARRARERMERMLS